MSLTSTQIGAIGENLLANAMMKASDGRLSPFQPLADDDGLDMLFFDKKTGKSVAIQLKCRTVTLHKRNSEECGNTVHFQVRQATFNETRCAHLVTALLNEELTDFVAIWFMPMTLLPEEGNRRPDKIVIRPSKAEDSADRYRQYRPPPKELTAKSLGHRHHRRDPFGLENWQRRKPSQDLPPCPSAKTSPLSLRVSALPLAS